jgi:hypothetical protein
VGTLAGTYNRHQYLQEKRQALEAWAKRVEFIVNGSGGKVVVLRPGRRIRNNIMGQAYSKA